MILKSLYIPLACAFLCVPFLSHASEKGVLKPQVEDTANNVVRVHSIKKNPHHAGHIFNKNTEVFDLELEQAKANLDRVKQHTQNLKKEAEKALNEAVKQAEKAAAAAAAEMQKSLEQAHKLISSNKKQNNTVVEEAHKQAKQLAEEGAAFAQKILEQAKERVNELKKERDRILVEANEKAKQATEAAAAKAKEVVGVATEKVSDFKKQQNELLEDARKEAKNASKQVVMNAEAKVTACKQVIAELKKQRDMLLEEAQLKVKEAAKQAEIRAEKLAGKVKQIEEAIKLKKDESKREELEAVRISSENAKEAVRAVEKQAREAVRDAVSKTIQMYSEAEDKLVEDTAYYEHIQLANLHFKQQDRPTALVALDSAIAVNPELVEGYELRARVNLADGNYATALADYSRIIALQPTSPKAYVDRAVAYALLEDMEKADDDFNAAVGQMEDEALASITEFLLSSMEEHAGVMSENLDVILDQMYTSDSHSATPHLIRAYFHYMYGDKEQSSLDLAEALKVSPDDEKVLSLQEQFSTTQSPANLIISE
jgi:tetratricopeptide (TPR) repeat protein